MTLRPANGNRTDDATCQDESAGVPDLYLNPSRAGVAWLLDPESDAVSKLAHSAVARTGADRCDPIALLRDLDDLEVLVNQRHFGIATGELSSDLVTDVFAAWRRRLRAERPATWGEALGVSVHELRWALRDNHLRAAGEDDALLDTVDPRRDEPRSARDPGPVVEEAEVDGVLCIRIRQCGGRSKSSEDLMLAWQRAHERHFSHDRIVVDLRANPGGADTFIIEWIRAHVATEVVWPPWREWRIDGQILNRWNVSVVAEAGLAGEALAAEYDRATYRLNPSSRLEVVDDPFSIPAASTPWRGKMLVITDRGSESSAEGGAWMLRVGLGAYVIGGRSAGTVSFGNMAPYLLPRSGLMVNLPTASASRHDESMVGLPIDLAIDVQTPLPQVASNFEELYAAAAANNGSHQDGAAT